MDQETRELPPTIRNCDGPGRRPQRHSDYHDTYGLVTPCWSHTTDRPLWLRVHFDL